MISIFLSFFLITAGNAQYLSLSNWGANLQYLGYLILLTKIFINFYKYDKEKIKLVSYYFIVVFLFNIGIVIQNMDLGAKVRLVMTTVVIATVAILSQNLLRNYTAINIACMAILMAIMFTTILSVVTHTSLTNIAVEGIGSSFGFNGGLQHKNALGEDALISLIGLYFCKGKTKYKKINRYLMLICVLLIILSNARECYIWFGIFVLYELIYNLKFVSKVQKSVFVLVSGTLVITIGIFLFRHILANSGSYGMRTQGLINYLNMYSNNRFVMLFGNAPMAWRNSGLSYEENIRSVTGWNGTVELALLNILVKNGVIGLIGYILIFFNYIKDFTNMYSCKEKKYGFLVIIIMLTSTLVQSSVVGIQSIFGIFGYLLINHFLGTYIDKKNKQTSISDNSI